MGELSSVERILDFGCGDGSLLELLPARERIGIDAIEENRRRVRDRGLDARERLADVSDEWADLVVSHHALEHTLHPLAELAEIRRVTRTGGRLLLYVPADDWRVNRAYRADDRNHHLYTWTPLALGHLLGEAGFDVERCQIEQRALPGRATVALDRLLPIRAFDLVCTLTSYVKRRREILAVATRPA